MRSWALRFALVVVAAAGPSSRAFAQPSPAPRDDGEATGRAGRVVAVAIADDPDEYRALTEALAELFGRLGLRMEAQRVDERPWPADGPPPFGRGGERARVWVDARTPTRVDVIVSVNRGGTFGRPVERSVVRTDPSAIVTEQVAHVAYAALESMLDEPPPEPPPPAPNQPPPASPSTRPEPSKPSRPGVELDAAAFGSTRAVASTSGPAVGGGVAFAFSARRLPMHPGLWVTAGFDAPFDTTSEAMVLETSLSSFRVLPSVELFASSTVRLEVAAGAGIDLFHTIPRDSRRPSVELGSTRTLGDPVLAVQLIAELRVAWSARAFLAAGADYDFGVHRYVSLPRTGPPDVVMQPWSIRPVALLGLSIPLAGETAYARSE